MEARGEERIASPYPPPPGAGIGQKPIDRRAGSAVLAEQAHERNAAFAAVNLASYRGEDFPSLGTSVAWEAMPPSGGFFADGAGAAGRVGSIF
jgi:hypothetical protein